MLERVALHQTRFHAPGLAPDARGVAIGQKLALLFSSLDRLVGFFRIYSEQAPIDDILPTLSILRVRTPVAAHELLVTFAAESSYRCDRAARVARLLGGLVFTGSGKHLVQYRDEVSPLGYDVAEVSGDEGDLLLYAANFTQAYQRADEVPFRDLVFRLQLVAEPGTPDVSGVEFFYLAARRGLGPAVLRYLWRSRVECAATLCEPPETSSFGERAALWIVRLPKLPERMLALWSKTPGLTLYRPLGANVAVELGWRHPIHLESCLQLFPREQFFLFSGKSDSVEVLGGPLDFVAGDAFVQPTWQLGRDRRAEGAQAKKPQPLEVPLRLERSTAPPRRVSAALLPWSQAAWLKKLVYTLPPTLLRGHRIALIQKSGGNPTSPAGNTGDGDLIVIVADARLDVIPLGTPMQELAQGLYVPVGFELAPRASAEALAQHLSAGPDRLVFFAPQLVQPLALDVVQLAPLERRVLAQITVDHARTDQRLGTGAAPGEPEIINAPTGAFALWGFKVE
jgi:hypothetical protein